MGDPAGAARSGADAVFAELLDGPDTVLSREFQGGRDLSGGQWQRISVARGLYRDAGRRWWTARRSRACMASSRVGR
ncbi:ABC transporter ATP-binding protein, partial [Pseudonocardia bannensis]|uniref:ABC transporter ATP-binding protein n=1 Tax=Pseudonocardia bannensis TaxID=630973 RepID=UPI001B7D12C3